MKFTDSFYAIGDLEKKCLRIRYTSAPCSLANKGADHLQTVCNPMLGFFPIAVRNYLKGNNRLDPCLHYKRLKIFPRE